MFFPEGQVRVFVYGVPVNMRYSFDGLYALVKNRMGMNPLDGSLFAFINRRATQMKILYFDRTGLCTWAKRLAKGRLLGNWDTVRTRQMDWTGLKLMLEGIEPKRMRKRYRYADACDKNLRGDLAEVFSWRRSAPIIRAHATAVHRAVPRSV